MVRLMRLPPTTRLITTTRKPSSSTARRSASSAWRPPSRWRSTASCTRGRVSLARLVELLSVNPARILRVPGGSLEPGGPADVTILAPDVVVTVQARAFRSKSHNTPFDGWRLRGAVAATIVGGRPLYVNQAVPGADAWQRP